MNTKKYWQVVFPLLVGMFLVCRFEPAYGHGVFIFAWTDGDRICTESYFSGSQKVIGGKVSMLSSNGALLAQGTTDSLGKVCFPVPAESSLKFAVEAGQGHRAEFLFQQEQVTAPPKSDSVQPVETSGHPQVSSDETLRQIVREELAAQLSPLKQQLAEGKLKGKNRTKDIVGGIGWIIGICALVALTISSRKKEQR